MNKATANAIKTRDAQWKHAEMMGRKYGVSHPAARSARRIWAVYVAKVEHLANGGTEATFELPSSEAIAAAAK